MESFIPPDPCLCTVLLEHLRITTTFPYFPLWKAFHNGKSRQCPLWKLTAGKLRGLVDHRPSAQPVFLNRHGQALTRYGIHTLVERYAQQAALTTPTLRTKRVSPHTIRHATAMALLRSGVDINTIRIWLGHVSLQTTHLYAESDLKMKAKALARCEAPLLEEHKGPSPRKGLMGFLRTL